MNYNKIRDIELGNYSLDLVTKDEMTKFSINPMKDEDYEFVIYEFSDYYPKGGLISTNCISFDKAIEELLRRLQDKSKGCLFSVNFQIHNKMTNERIDVDFEVDEKLELLSIHSKDEVLWEKK